MIAALDGTDTTGVWCPRPGILRAYLPAGDSDPRAALEAAWLATWGGDLPFPVTVRPTPPVDWIARTREAARAVAVTPELWIVPPGAVPPPGGWPADSIRIVIEPGQGFGTGSHPTTRALLKWIDAEPTPGAVLDVGTGSGVLALAALARGARRAIGLDIDPAALSNTRTNMDLNPSLGPLWRVRGSVETIAPGARFDRVLANLDAPTLGTLLPRLAALAAVGGRVGLAGVLEEERAAVLETALGAGLELLVQSVDPDPSMDGAWWSGWLSPGTGG